jgi:metal-responsive CopG/Arc/MetJ family transcriptional regulator
MAKVLVSMSDDFLNMIDKFATSEQRTRSELVREALRTYIRRSKISNPEVNEERAKTLEDLLD